MGGIKLYPSQTACYAIPEISLIHIQLSHENGGQSMQTDRQAECQFSYKYKHYNKNNRKS